MRVRAQSGAGVALLWLQRSIELHASHDVVSRVRRAVASISRASMGMDAYRRRTREAWGSGRSDSTRSCARAIASARCSSLGSPTFSATSTRARAGEGERPDFRIDHDIRSGHADTGGDTHDDRTKERNDRSTSNSQSWVQRRRQRQESTPGEPCPTRGR